MNDIFRMGRAVRVSALALVGAGLLSSIAIAQEEPQGAPGWSYKVERIATGVNNGYQLAFDEVGRQVYFADTRWRTEERNAEGNVTVTQRATGKVVQFDAETRSIVNTYSYLGLSRMDGNGTEGDAFDWTGVEGESLSSMRTQFSPYGIAVANNGGDPYVVTTTARARDPELGYGGNAVIFQPSQGEPTDAARLWAFEDGSPIFDGLRRVDVNNATNKAYFSNFAGARSEAGGRAGFVVVVDLPTKTVDTRIGIPEGGVIGVAVDEERNLVYVGTISAEKLYVIDANELDTSDPQNFDLNADAVTELAAVVPQNARPTYSPTDQRLYIASYADPEGTITVVDANPDSATYGQTIETIVTDPANAVAVDGERGLLYSANLGAREVVVYKTDDFSEVLRLPTTGNALNIGIDPVTHDVWVSNFAQASITDVFSVSYVEPAE